MSDSSRSYFGSAVVPFRLVFLMWAVFAFELYTSIDLSFLGIVPRTGWGLIGIFTAPLIHGNLIHLASNTIPLLFLGGTLFFFYNRIGVEVFFRCYFATNFAVWLLARPSLHIGASGLVYALSSFLILFGLLRKELLSFLISIVVIILYGGMYYGVLPTTPWISWESHLAGTIVGAITAISFRKRRIV